MYSFYNTNSTHRLCPVFQSLGLILQSVGSVLVLLCRAGAARERDHAPTHYCRNGSTDWARWGRVLGLYRDRGGKRRLGEREGKGERARQRERSERNEGKKSEGRGGVRMIERETG